MEWTYRKPKQLYIVTIGSKQTYFTNRRLADAYAMTNLGSVTITLLETSALIDTDEYKQAMLTAVLGNSHVSK